MPAAAVLATASSFSELHSLATFHEFRAALQRPLRHLWERGYIDEAAAAALRSAVPCAGSALLRELLASEDAQRHLEQCAALEVRLAILRGVVRLMQQPDLRIVPGEGRAEAAPEDEVPGGGEALLDWADAAGVLEALEAPAAEVIGSSGAPAEYETIASVFSPEHLLPWRRWAAPDPARLGAARAFLLAQRDEARRAVQEELEGPPRAEAPAAWKDLVAALAGWRARARPHVLPTTREVRGRGTLELVFGPPRFLYRDPRPILRPRPPNRTEVTIFLEDVGRGGLVVSCDVCEQSTYCRHALAAVDRLAEWLCARRGNGNAPGRSVTPSQ